MVVYFLIKTKLDRTLALENKVWNHRWEIGCIFAAHFNKRHFKRFSVPDQ